MLFNSARLLVLQRSNVLSALAIKQIGSSSIRYLASLQLTHLHFLSNSNNVYEKEKTGLLNRQNVHIQYSNYLQSKLLHSHSILYVNNSNITEQKVNRNSTSNDEKKEEDPKSVDTQTAESTKNANDEKPLTLYAKFKKMAREYWYVLIPVHAFTSVFWIGGFYYASLK